MILATAVTALLTLVIQAPGPEALPVEASYLDPEPITLRIDPSQVAVWVDPAQPVEVARLSVAAAAEWFRGDIDLAGVASAQPLTLRPGVTPGEALALARQLALAPGIGAASPRWVRSEGTTGHYLNGRLLVRWKAGVTSDRIGALEQVHGLTVLRELRFSGPSGLIYSMDTSGADDEFSVSTALVRTGLVRWAVPDMAIETQLTGDCSTYDPLVCAEQWHLGQNEINECDELDRHIHAFEAWELTLGDADQRIAIVDESFQDDHEDLAGVFADVGLDIVNGDDEPFSCDVAASHGTAVAGTAAAPGTNLIGVSGVAPLAEILPVRVTSPGSPVQAGDACEAFLWAKDHQAVVINNSWEIIAPMDQAIEDVVLECLREGRGGLGTLMVFGAGNNNVDWGDGTWAASEHVLSVAGIERTGQPWVDTPGVKGSNFGDTIDLCAPAKAVYTTLPEQACQLSGGTPGSNPPHTYANRKGTSFAAPQVSATLHLMLSANPGLHWTQLRHLIQRTAVDPTAPICPDGSESHTSPFGPDGTSPLYGHGLLHAGDAVAEALTTTPWMCTAYGAGTPGSTGVTPYIQATSNAVVGNAAFGFLLEEAEPGATCLFKLSWQPAAIPSQGGLLLVDPNQFLLETTVVADGDGNAVQPVPLNNDPALIGLHVYAQWVVQEAGGTTAFSRGLDCEFAATP